MDTTARYALPLLAAGQAEKESFHNEALQRVDACVAPSVAGAASATPPGSPTVGDCFIVGVGATGAWAGKVGSLAFYGDGGWRFIAAREGLRVWVSGQAGDALYRSGAWEYGIVRGNQLSVGGTKVVGAQQAAIGDPTGGSVVDAQSRSAIVSILAALRVHGLIAP